MRTRVLTSLGTLALTTTLGVAAVATTSASAAATKAPKPTITSMSVSSSNVKPSGVLVHVSATTEHARYCALSTKPQVGKVIKAVDCSHGSFQHAVRVPDNDTPFVKRFTITVTASGRGGSRSRSLTIQQLPAEPSITHLTISPRRPTYYGGPVTLSANLHSTVRCWLTAGPGLTVSSKLFRCSKSVSKVVHLPQNYTGYKRTFTVYLHARNPSFSTSAGYKLFQPAAPPSFVSFGSKPRRVLADGGWVTISATFVRAQRCIFSYDFPRKSGGSVGSCKGSFKQTFHIPANHTGKRKTFTWTLKLRGRGGRAGEEYSITQPFG